MHIILCLVKYYKVEPGNKVRSHFLSSSCRKRTEEEKEGKGGVGGRRRRLAGFNVLHLEEPVAHIRLRQEYYALCFWVHLFATLKKNQYCDLETQGLDGPARSRSK